MQYEIVLPADYDMAVIDERVAARGSMTDDYPHLGLKAYAVRRRGRFGSAVNAYAPFYLWRDTRGMTSFLGEPFRGLVDDFGRPVVRHWVATAFHAGPHVGRSPVLATRTVSLIEPDVAPGPAMAAAAAVPVPAAAHSVVVGLDPSRWELVRLTLWAEPPDDEPAAGSTTYEVLHTSSPGLAELPSGPLV